MVMCRDGGRGAPENRPKMRPETWSGKWRRRRKAARQGTLLGLGEVDVVACVEPVQRGLVLLWAHSGPHFCVCFSFAHSFSLLGSIVAPGCPP